MCFGRFWVLPEPPKFLRGLEGQAKRNSRCPPDLWPWIRATLHAACRWHAALSQRTPGAAAENIGGRRWRIDLLRKRSARLICCGRFWVC